MENAPRQPDAQEDGVRKGRLARALHAPGRYARLLEARMERRARDLRAKTRAQRAIDEAHLYNDRHGWGRRDTVGAYLEIWTGERAQSGFPPGCPLGRPPFVFQVTIPTRRKRCST
jgi:hypothetical protein